MQNVCGRAHPLAAAAISASIRWKPTSLTQWTKVAIVYLPVNGVLLGYRGGCSFKAPRMGAGIVALWR
jgi:hypothetical protein